MKIFIFCQQLEYMGGIERVVLEQLRIFSECGVSVELLLERKLSLMSQKVTCPWTVLPDETNVRQTMLKELFLAKKPDLIIFHGVSHSNGAYDAKIAAECGVRSVCVVHFSFLSNLALEGGVYSSWQDFITKGRPCVAFATVSAIDAVFWRALGKKAFHVQNPFVHPSERVVKIRRDGEDGAANLIWVGRLCEPKQPRSALDVFARAVCVCPRIQLTMVGGDVAGIRNLKKYARRLGILAKVKFVPESPDIDEYWAKADIHLLTSVCESFCLVWAEAKAAGIPTVMFELPYLELAADKRGYIAVEQRNVEALADAIVDLVRDVKKRQKMGREAQESLAPFNDEAVWQSWMRLFDGLDDPKAGTEVDSDLKTIVSQIYVATCYDKAVHRWPEEMADDWHRLTRTSMRHVANLLHRMVVAGRWLKVKVFG